MIKIVFVEYRGAIGSKSVGQPAFVVERFVFPSDVLQLEFGGDIVLIHVGHLGLDGFPQVKHPEGPWNDDRGSSAAA
jgi:hypothetical protein